jgi:hypothetical protein
MRILEVSFILTITAASFLSGLKSIQSIKSLESSTIHFENTLHLGENSYIFRYKNSCIGGYKVNFKKVKSSYTLHAEGFFNILLNGKAENVSTKAEGAFNDFYQLGGSLFTIKIQDATAAAGTVGIDPIQFKAYFRDKTVTRDFTFPFRGPILISKTGKDLKTGSDSFGLKFPALKTLPLLKQLSETPPHILFQKMLSDFAIERIVSIAQKSRDTITLESENDPRTEFKLPQDKTVHDQQQEILQICSKDAAALDIQSLIAQHPFFNDLQKLWLPF